MDQISQKLSYLILGHRGGLNKVSIIKLLHQRPYNINQLALKMNLNYRTVKHHIEILRDHKLVVTSRSGNYGEVYFLSKEMEENMDAFDRITRQLTEVIYSPKFIRNILEYVNEGILVADSEGRIRFCNFAAKEQFGYEPQEVIGNTISFLFGQEIEERILREKDTWIPMKRNVVKVRHKTGMIIDIAVTIDQIWDEEGKFIGFSILSSEPNGASDEMNDQ